MPSRTKKTEDIKEETPVEEVTPSEEPEKVEEPTKEEAPKDPEPEKVEEKPAEEKKAEKKPTAKKTSKPAKKPAKKPAAPKTISLVKPTAIYRTPDTSKPITMIAGAVSVAGEVGKFYEVVTLAGGRNQIHGYIFK